MLRLCSNPCGHPPTGKSPGTPSNQSGPLLAGKTMETTIIAVVLYTFLWFRFLYDRINAKRSRTICINRRDVCAWCLSYAIAVGRGGETRRTSTRTRLCRRQHVDRHTTLSSGTFFCRRIVFFYFAVYVKIIFFFFNVIISTNHHYKKKTLPKNDGG